MTDEDALIAGIHATPDDDTPPLVLADWYDEHDQPRKAEFLRLLIGRLRDLPSKADAVRFHELRQQIPEDWLRAIHVPRYIPVFPSPPSAEERAAEARRREEEFRQQETRARAEAERLAAVVRREREEAAVRDAEERRKRLRDLKETAGAAVEAGGVALLVVGGTALVIGFVLLVVCFLEEILIGVGIALGVLFGGAILVGGVLGIGQAVIEIAQDELRK